LEKEIAPPVDTNSEWYPKKPVEPKVCPKCKSYAWKEPRKKKNE